MHTESKAVNVNNVFGETGSILNINQTENHVNVLLYIIVLLRLCATAKTVIFPIM